MMRHWFAPLLLRVGALAACAERQVVPTATPPKAATEPRGAAPVDREAALKDRVTRFWEARLKDDMALQYEFLDPETKERMTLTAFVLGHGAIRSLSYEVQTIDIVGEKAWVNVMYRFKVKVPQLAAFGPWTREVPEIWIWWEGAWYRPHDQKEALTPPPGVRLPRKILLDKPG